MDNILDHTPSVLIIDDKPENIDILIANLQDENIGLMVALTGEDGLQLTQETQPDLILLDIMMPEMDGYETCRRLKEDPRTSDIPVIFLSAKDDFESIEHGLSLGAVDYIYKPFSIPILKVRLNTHIALKKKGEQLQQQLYRDQLTPFGIANQYYFNFIFARESLRAQRSKLDLSIILIHMEDLDDKSEKNSFELTLNELKELALKMVTHLQRPADLLAHLGGQKFAAILPETNLQSAQGIANRLLESLSNISFDQENSNTSSKKAFSIGLATAEPGKSTSIEVLFKAASEALNQAKLLGQNKLSICYEY